MLLQKLIYFFLTTNILQINAKQLKQLILLYRHGDRTPNHEYPNYKLDYNKNFNEIWPKGKGQLTLHGLKQHFELGNYLKTRYKNFINDNYFPNELYIRSTDFDRTLMSAMANSAGMYKNQSIIDTGNIKIPNLNSKLFSEFQPIPVHTVPEKNDIALELPNKNEVCPKYQKLLEIIKKSEYFKEVHEKYKEVFDILSLNSGLDEHITIWNLSIMADTINVSYFHNLPLPKWLSKTNFLKMNELIGIKFFLHFSDYEEKLYNQMSRLNGGLFIKTVQEDISRMLNKTLAKDEQFLYEDSNKGGYLSHHKIKIYSAHDSTISAVLVALKKYNFLAPPYASCLIFELYDNEEIILFYRNDTFHEPYELKLCKTPNQPCFFEVWKNLTKPIVVNTREQFNFECQVKEKRDKNDYKIYRKELQKSIEIQKNMEFELTITLMLLISSWLAILAKYVFNCFYGSEKCSASRKSD